MMWLTSPVTHFLTGVSQGTCPNFSKGWCARELIIIMKLVKIIVLITLMMMMIIVII